MDIYNSSIQKLYAQVHIHTVTVNIILLVLHNRHREHTITCEAISSVSNHTGTVIASNSVSAVGIGATVIVTGINTLINI